MLTFLPGKLGRKSYFVLSLEPYWRQSDWQHIATIPPFKLTRLVLQSQGNQLSDLNSTDWLCWLKAAQPIKRPSDCCWPQGHQLIAMTIRTTSPGCWPCAETATADSSQRAGIGTTMISYNWVAKPPHSLYACQQKHDIDVVGKMGSWFKPLQMFFIEY